MNALELIQVDSASERSAHLETCRATKQAQESATWTHYRAAMDFKASEVWKPEYPNWTAVVRAHCEGNTEGNPVSLFSASYYRTLSSSLPIAQAMELATGESLLPTQAKVLQGKLWEIIPEGEREAPLLLSMLALSYAAFPDSIVPAKNVLDEAYQILKDERDLHAISFDGKTYDFKLEAQIKQLKERVVQDIAARSTRSTIEIAETRHLGLILRAFRRLGYRVPSENKKLFISWKD